MVVSSFAINFPRFVQTTEVVLAPVLAYQTERVELPLLPTLRIDAQTSPTLSAQAVLVMDINSGVYLFEKNPDASFLPASTTKMITALVALDTFDLSDVLLVKNPSVEGQKMGLVVNEQITAESLLNGLLIQSANDAAEVFAQNYPGGREEFVLAMNRKAFELGLLDSNFTNPAGLDDFAQITTARDMVIAGIFAMTDPHFAEIVKKEKATVTDTTGTIVHNLKSTNELLGVAGVYGIKTGWTENARENLVTYIDRDGKRIAIALLGSQDRFGETKTLIDWIYANYSWEEVAIGNSTLENQM